MNKRSPTQSHFLRQTSGHGQLISDTSLPGFPQKEKMSIRILLDGVRISYDDAIERSRIEEEKESTERCLRICAEASKNVI
jgi:hypothetical protein